MILKFKNKILEKDCKITYFYDGTITLEFELFENEFVDCEEVFSISNENKFIVKSIDDYIVNCELDFTELKEDVFNGIKKFESQSLNDTLHQLLDKYNWQIINTQSISKKRTLEVEDESVVSAIFKCQKLYECTFQFDCLNKILKVIDEPNRTDFIISDDINLISFKIKSDTYEHYTRIFGYGKDDLNFSSINDGKEYLDNFEFNKNIIPVIFRDDRFSDPASLKKHCEILLNKHSTPLLEYEILISDIKRLNPGIIESNLKLHDEVIFFNTKTQKKEKHRIIEFVKYSDNPTKNEIKLINRSESLTDLLSDFKNEITTEIQKEIGKIDFSTKFDESISRLNERFEKLLINGHKIETENATYYVDKLPKEDAVNVLKIGLGGILGSSNGWNGNFELAISNNGEINADRILTGYIDVDRLKANSITADKLTVNAKEELREGLITQANFKVLSDEIKASVGLIEGKQVKNIDYEYHISDNPNPEIYNWVRTPPSNEDLENKYIFFRVVTIHKDNNETYSKISLYSTPTEKIYIKYSENPDGENFSDISNKYIGISRSKSATPPLEKSSYSWSKFKGEDGNTLFAIPKFLGDYTDKILKNFRVQLEVFFNGEKIEDFSGNYKIKGVPNLSEEVQELKVKNNLISNLEINNVETSGENIEIEIEIEHENLKYKTFAVKENRINYENVETELNTIKSEFSKINQNQDSILHQVETVKEIQTTDRNYLNETISKINQRSDEIESNIFLSSTDGETLLNVENLSIENVYENSIDLESSSFYEYKLKSKGECIVLIKMFVDATKRKYPYKYAKKHKPYVRVFKKYNSNSFINRIQYFKTPPSLRKVKIYISGNCEIEYFKISKNATKSNIEKLSQLRQDLDGFKLTVQDKTKEISSEIIQKSNEITQKITDERNKTTNQIQQINDNLNLKVSKDKLISEINLSPEGIKIDSSKVEVHGDFFVHGILGAYRGDIGGFKLGEEKGYKWLTGASNFNVGISDGQKGTYRRTAIWANWGGTWESANSDAWLVRDDGEMVCGRKAIFKGGLDSQSSIYVGEFLEIATNDIYYNKSKRDKVVWESELPKESDIKLKENIKNSDVNALEVLKNIEVVQFDWKPDAEKKGHEKIGFVAQWLEKLIPESIHEKRNGIKGIMYSDLVPYLVKSIQELNSENEYLKNEIEFLKNEFLKLKGEK